MRAVPPMVLATCPSCGPVRCQADTIDVAPPQDEGDAFQAYLLCPACDDVFERDIDLLNARLLLNGGAKRFPELLPMEVYERRRRPPRVAGPITEGEICAFVRQLAGVRSL